MDKKFCLPYNGDLDLVKEVASKYGNKIYEFYGDDGVFYSSRTPCDYENDPETRKRSLEAAVKYLSENDINFNYTLNSIQIYQYLDEQKLSSGFFLLLDHLKTLGIKWVTVVHPFLVSYVKDAGLNVSNSTLTNTYTETGIKYLLDYGFDRIMINENYTKQVETLRYLQSVIPSYVQSEILITNNCRLNCPNKPAHYLAGYFSDVQIFCDNFCKCDNLSLSDYLKRVWIRHQDVQRYQKIGINLFKISGRQINSRQLLGQLEYFLNDTYYQDSYIEYMYTKYGIKKNETELDEFFDFLFSRPGCTGRCTECGFCERFAKKLLQE